MQDIKIELDSEGKGSFFLDDGNKRVAEMSFKRDGKKLTVFHTQISPHLDGKGVAGKLLEAMADYIRQEKLKVIPLCTYVSTQFKRHPEKYGDILDR